MEEVEIDLPDEDFMRIALMAHERDITFNQMCNIIIMEFIQKEGFREPLYCISCGHEIPWDEQGRHVCGE